MIETERSPAASTIGKSSHPLRLETLPGAARDALIVAGAFVVVVGLLRVFEPAGGVAAFATLAFVARRRPGWLLALALTGTFVYLGALALAGRAPYSAMTGAYDAMLGVLLVAVAWTRRGAVVARLRTRPAQIWVAAALLVAAWFCAAVVVLAHGPSAAHFAGLLILVSLPAALAAFAWDRALLDDLRDALVGLGLILTVVTVLGLVLGRDTVNGRVDPIAYYDPISAAAVVAIGALALLATLPVAPRPRIVAVGGFVVLAGMAFVFGARGPVLALVAGIVVIVAVAGRSVLIVAIPAVAIALVLGAGLEELKPTAHAKTEQTPPSSSGSGSGAGSGSASVPPPAPPAISSINMRRQWLESAVRQFPDRPLFGHGVGMLLDNTPESKRMHTTGLIWPHNDIAEAAHALGLLGLLPFLVFLAVPVAALVRLARRFDRPAISLLGGLFAFAFVESNFSGEIGSDWVLWASAALLVAAWAEVRRRATLHAEQVRDRPLAAGGVEVYQREVSE